LPKEQATMVNAVEFQLKETCFPTNNYKRDSQFLPFSVSVSFEQRATLLSKKGLQFNAITRFVEKMNNS